jgi:hypothetical protein
MIISVWFGIALLWTLTVGFICYSAGRRAKTAKKEHDIENTVDLCLRLAALLFIYGGLTGLVGWGLLAEEARNKQGDSHLLADLGQFLSGTTGVLWSGAAIFMVAVAYWRQREEFKKNQDQASIEQVERTFFEMVNWHHKIVDGIEMLKKPPAKDAPAEEKEAYKYGDRYFSGRRCMADMKRQFKEKQKNVTTAQHGRESFYHAIEVYNRIYAAHKQYLGHYFRNLYHIVAYLDGCGLEKKEIVRLMKFLRAQLSNAELFLLFYNGISVYGRKRFYRQIIRYSLLAPLDFTKDDDWSLLEKHSFAYPKEARDDEHRKEERDEWTNELCEASIKRLEAGEKGIFLTDKP